MSQVKNGSSCWGSSRKTSHKFRRRYVSSGTFLITLIIAQWPVGKDSLWASSPPGCNRGSSPPWELTAALKSYKLTPDKLARRQENRERWLFDIAKWITRPSAVLPQNGGGVSRGPRGCIRDGCSLWGRSITQRKRVWISHQPRATMKMWSMCQWRDSIIKGKCKKKGGKKHRNITVMQFSNWATIIPIRSDKSIGREYFSIKIKGWASKKL